MARLTVGVTGQSGFVGSHFCDRLRREEDVSVVPFEKCFFADPCRLKEFLAKCDVVVHLAAMNRGDDEHLYRTNVELVSVLARALDESGATPHVVFASSIQCERDNPYGRSKKEGARILQQWAESHEAPLTVMIIPNVFGDRARPYYNSVVATFCHQLTHNEQPKVLVDNKLSLIYINELTEMFVAAVKSPPKGVDILQVAPTCRIKVSELLALLESFKNLYYELRTVPSLANTFERNLYNTFVAYMDHLDYQQHPRLHTDSRGWLFEVLKHQDGGQVFFSATKPHVTRGDHYHTRKTEKFCVVHGEAIIRLRRMGTDCVYEYRVSGKSPCVVEIPAFYTHNIENMGTTDLLALFWASELFDPADSDTFSEKV